MDIENQTGGCACGAVRFAVEGAPLRAGLCHCRRCQRELAAPFNAFIVYPADKVAIVGRTVSWACTPTFHSSFCPVCGSRVAGGDGVEIEVAPGSFDAPPQIAPQYELWVGRRLSWVKPLDVPQYEGNRS